MGVVLKHLLWEDFVGTVDGGRADHWHSWLTEKSDCVRTTVARRTFFLDSWGFGVYNYFRADFIIFWSSESKMTLRPFDS